jgi:hypothetical protein
MNPDALGAILLMICLSGIVGCITIFFILRYVKDDYKNNKIRKG